MSLAPGSQLGPYEVLSLVGSGGMGEVYRAHDSRLGRDVAIKIIKDEHLRSPDALARFEREARAVAHLNHPHIARLYDRGEQRGTHFLVMEYLAGESLAVRLRRGALSLPDALRYASEMADALDHAHHAGILHRDLKPANVLLTADGVKLVDFGLAKEIVVAGATTATPLTAHGALVGTYQYMAPEQLDGRDPDARSDVFAVGAVLFEMMTGQRAFAGHTSARIAAAILHDVPVPVSQLQPLASSAIDKVVRVCLAKDPDDRWQTAAELRDRLRTIRIGTKRPPRTKAAATLPSAAEPSSSQRSAASRICGLAVLPLRDLSGDEAQNYFADGMTESLITSLAKIGALKVIARSSVMAYKASSKPLREIARELKVDAVLEGSVTRGQERVGVNLQLVRVATDSTIWAEQYNRDLTDVLEVQSEVARAVADAIKVTITPSEQLGLRAAAKVVREAHDEYLKGDFALNRQTKDGLAAAFAHFTRAIELDSGHALSQVGLSKYYQAAGLYRLIAHREAFASARTAALRAIDLDPSLATAFGALGSVALYEWDFAGAERAFLRALSLSASDSLTRQKCALHLAYHRRFDEALSQIEIAQELDPCAPGPYIVAANIFFAMRDFRQAIASADRAIEVGPPSPPAHYRRGLALVLLGELDEALQAMREAVRTSDRHPSALAGMVIVHARRGETPEVTPLIAELERRCGDGEVTAFNLAEASVGIGEHQRAIQYLQRAFTERLPEMVGIATDPIFAELRHMQEFAVLIERIGL